jgi:hypothetical protein
MNRFAVLSYLVAGISLVTADASFASSGFGAPAPILAAGPAGFAVLAVAGVGYVAVRAFRRRR